MTIEIDDSGTGEMVGSAFIGIHRIETSKILIKELPVYLFDEYGMAMETPKFKAIDVIKQGLEELEYLDNEIIHICQGNFFDKVWIYFRQENILYKKTRIEGKLQKEIEKKYKLHLEKIGFIIKPEHESKFLEDYKFRNKCLKIWVSKDYKNRLKYIKAGYKKGFKRLLDLIERKLNVDREKILEYYIQDSILTLKKFCVKNNYQIPCYYFFIDNSWEKDNILQSLFFEEGRDHLVGVSVRKIDDNHSYSEDFELEQNDPNSITTIGKGHSRFARDAELRASAKICEKLNLTYKKFEESNY